MRQLVLNKPVLKLWVADGSICKYAEYAKHPFCCIVKFRPITFFLGIRTYLDKNPKVQFVHAEKCKHSQL